MVSTWLWFSAKATMFTDYNNVGLITKLVSIKKTVFDVALEFVLTLLNVNVSCLPCVNVYT